MKTRKQNRKFGYDYSQDNLYFVTICVQDRKCCFGNVEGTGRDLSVHDADCKPSAKVELNEFGIIVYNQWKWVENQYPYVYLHSFIVMPNHFHGILEIDRTGRDLSVLENVKIKSLSELIGAYKTTSSKKIHEAGLFDFSWQRSFHDHIIRNDISYERISNYIDTNAERWKADTFFEL